LRLSIARSLDHQETPRRTIPFSHFVGLETIR
jgi:hypothetical protein